MARRRKQEFEMISDSDRDPALMAYLAESEDAYYAALTEFLDEREDEETHQPAVFDEIDALDVERPSNRAVPSDFFQRHPLLQRPEAERRFIFHQLRPDDHTSPESILMSVEEVRLSDGIAAAIQALLRARETYPMHPLICGRLAELHERAGDLAARNRLLRHLVETQEWSTRGDVIVDGYAQRARRLPPRFQEWLSLEMALGKADDYSSIVLGQASAFEALIRMTLVDSMPSAAQRAVLDKSKTQKDRERLEKQLGEPPTRISLGSLAFWLRGLKQCIEANDKDVAAWLSETMTAEIPPDVTGGGAVRVADLLASNELAMFIEETAAKWRNPLVHDDLNTVISQDRYTYWCWKMFRAESVTAWWEKGCETRRELRSANYGWMAKLLVAAWRPSWAWRSFDVNEFCRIVGQKYFECTPTFCRNASYRWNTRQPLR